MILKNIEIKYYSKNTKHRLIASANDNYNKKIHELYENIEETHQEVASKHSQELSDQKAYFEKEIEILKE